MKDTLRMNTELPLPDLEGPIESSGLREGATGMIPQPGEHRKSIVESKHLVVIDELINWMIMNPGLSVTKASHTLGGPIQFSTIWLKMVASSDAFKARLSEKQKEIDALLFVPQLREKLTATTEMAVERLSEMLPVATDPQFVLDAAEVLLKQTYVTPNVQPSSSQGTTVQVDTATIVIQQSRDRLLGKGTTIEVKEITNESDSASSS